MNEFALSINCWFCKKQPADAGYTFTAPNYTNQKAFLDAHFSREAKCASRFFALSLLVALEISVTSCRQQASLEKEFQYAKNGDAVSMKAEVAKGFDPSVYNAANGQASTTPLHIAAARGYDSIVSILLAAGVMVDLKTDDGSTPLFLACGSGKSSTAKILLDRGANPNIAPTSGNLKGEYPLGIASYSNDALLVKTLLDHGAEANSKSLVSACLSGNIDIATVLINKGADVNDGAGGSPPLFAAIQSGNTNLVKLLLTKGAIPLFGYDEVATKKHLPVMAKMLRDADPAKKAQRYASELQAQVDEARREVAAVWADSQRTGVLDKQKLDEIETRLKKLVK
jgi:ankyrin repeat protein